MTDEEADLLVSEGGLLSCPFCGGEGVLDGPEGPKQTWVVRCKACAAQGGWDKFKSGAVERWQMGTVRRTP